jgi:kumamolisin
MPTRHATASKGRSHLRGWEHTHLKDAQPATTKSSLTEPLEVTLVLRPRKTISPIRSPEHLSQKKFESQHRASTLDVTRIRKFAAAHNLTIAHDASHRRVIVLSGSAQALAQAFDTDFAHYHHPRTSYFKSSRTPSIPAELKDIVEAVFGLNNQPTARRQSLWKAAKPRGTSRSILELARTYAFPEGTDGTGQTIGLIELGGGFNPADVEDFCTRLGIPTPRITVVGVKGGANQPAPPRDVRRLLDFVNGKGTLSAKQQTSAAIEAAQCTVEATMDIEIVAALAPGAHIVVYFATPDEQGVYNAITRAIHDEQNRPSVLSISFGEPEIALSDAYIHAIDKALLAASHLGITVLASSGDAGALNNSPDNLPAVNFPASSPYCLACGGTTARLSRSKDKEEIVWNSRHHGIKGATGGGISRKFPVPPWQRKARVPLGPTGKRGRGVPDIAGPADPRYGCDILVAGTTCTSAGTSAVAPLWAALIARCNQALVTRCGHLNPLFYRLAQRGSPAFKPVIKGHNDVYQATEGWNPCAGHGTLHGEHLLRHLRPHLSKGR